MTETRRGVVKWFNDAKGFGFIEHESGKDVFVHYSVIAADGFKTLKDGEIVEYELNEGMKGLHALKVYRVTLPKSDTQEVGKKSEGRLEVEKITTGTPPSEGSFDIPSVGQDIAHAKVRESNM